MTRTLQSIYQVPKAANYIKLARFSPTNLANHLTPRTLPNTRTIPVIQIDPAILPSRRVLHTTPKMASDEDYMSFLNKANQDSSGSGNQATTQSKSQFKTTDSGSQPPAEIKSACKDAFYVSDADEPFEPVSLNYDGSDLPDEGLSSPILACVDAANERVVEFAKLIDHWDPDNADVSIGDTSDWDKQGQYSNLVDAVRKASKGNDVRVYTVTRDKTRVEYWVVSSAEGKIVGVKALAVES